MTSEQQGSSCFPVLCETVLILPRMQSKWPRVSLRFELSWVRMDQSRIGRFEMRCGTATLTLRGPWLIY